MSIGSYAAVIEGDLIEGSHLYGNTLQEGRSTQYILFENDEAAEEAAAERWNDMAHNDAQELIALVGADEIVRLWAQGSTLEDYVSENVTADGEFGCGETSLDVTGMLEYVKQEWPELEEWIDEQAESCGYDYSTLDTDAEAEDEDAEDKDRIVELLLIWQELLDELGFTPTIAYKN